MPQSSMKQSKGHVSIEEDELLTAARKLHSTAAQERLARVYACATLFHGEQSVDVAEARAGEAAALAAMERIATGHSTNVAVDLAEAETWELWHAKRAAAETQMEVAIVAQVRKLMARVFSATTVPLSAPPEDALKSAMEPPNNSGNTDVTPATTVNTRSSPHNNASAKTPLRNDSACAAPADAAEKTDSARQSSASMHSPIRVSTGVQKNAHNSTVNSDDHEKSNTSKDMEEGSGLVVLALTERKTDGEEEEDGDAPVAENASTRTPSLRETRPNDQDDDHDGSESAPQLATDNSSEEEEKDSTHQPLSLSVPKLAPSTMSVKKVSGAEGGVASAHVVPPPKPKRLCFEDHGLHFTQADFDAACAEVRQQRSGGQKDDDDELHAMKAGNMKADPSAAPLSTAGSKLLAGRPPPPPPQQVEDAGLRYVRRQLVVRHLQPFVCPLRALELRLAEGDATAFSPAASDTHEADESRSPHLTDPLMRRLLAELKEVCLHHPVPRVRVRPDAQVYRKDRGYFKADEVRVQLHVEVVPVSGPMAGEVVHVWVRVPAGYPFVAPRAHLTVELPHRRATGVAVDEVPHLIALSYENFASKASGVCPAPLHGDEVEQLQPLHGPMNNYWQSSLTLFHVFTALSDLFNVDEFAETVKELQNEQLFRNGLRRARVKMYEEENGAAREATSLVAVTATAEVKGTAAQHSSGSDEGDSLGEDSMGVTTNADDDVAPSFLLLCNGPFLTKPTASPSSSITQAASSSLSSLKLSLVRASEVDVDGDEGSVHTTCSTPPRRNNNGNGARRRQRKPLTYHEMDGDRVCGPWRGCWGHVLYGSGAIAATTTAATTGVTTSVSSPVCTGSNGGGKDSFLTASILHNGEHSTSVKSPRSTPAKQSVDAAAQHSLTVSPIPPSPTHRESGGFLFIRLKHHVLTAPAATVRLVQIPSHALREQEDAASVSNTPLHRGRSRSSTQSRWATTALGSSNLAVVPPRTAWTSTAPIEMEKEVLLCIHDHEGSGVDAPSVLAATMPRGCQRQYVNLHNLHEGSGGVSSTTVHSNSTSNNNTALVATAETNSMRTSESTVRSEEDECFERCYAVVVDVPEGQAVSFVFSTDATACLSLPWGGKAEDKESEDEEQEEKKSAHEPVSIITAASQWDADANESLHGTTAARSGILIELPYDEWQFHAASASTALANGAKKDEDIHPYWPRNVRFHGGQRVVPLSLTESTFRMYQLLQNTQVGSCSNTQASSYLAAAPYARVRQAYAATRNEEDRESMVRRYGFWGWRNLLLPVFSSDTQELVSTTLQAGSNFTASNNSCDGARRPSMTSAKVVARALRSWEEVAIDDFGVSCTQLHHDPDASVAYRAPFRAFAVLRTLALTVTYALEVMQTLQQTRDDNDNENKQVESEKAVVASAEAAALRNCLNKVLWNATVLTVATAATKPGFLEFCVALVDYMKQSGEKAAEATSTTTTTTYASRCEREVRLALSQLTELQRGAARVLAASTMSAFPKVEAERATSVEEASVSRVAAPSFSATSLADRVTPLLNAPTTPLLSDAVFDAHTIANRVSAFTKLIRPI